MVDRRTIHCRTTLPASHHCSSQLSHTRTDTVNGYAATPSQHRTARWPVTALPALLLVAGISPSGFWLFLRCPLTKAPKPPPRKPPPTFETPFFGLLLPSSDLLRVSTLHQRAVAPWAASLPSSRRGAAAAKREGGCAARPRDAGGARPEQFSDARAAVATSTTRSPSPGGDGTRSHGAALARPRTHSSHSLARTRCTRCR